MYEVKDLDMGKLSQIIQIGLKCNTTDKRREGNATMEAEIGVMWPQAKECLRTPETGRNMEQILL